MRIGIDLDNTIACYTDVFAVIARDLGLLDAGFEGDKAAVKAALMGRPGGETEWMRVQGQVYGAYMSRARVYPGVRDFLTNAVSRGAELLIISHKTEFGHFDPQKINLRDAARTWLAEQGIAGCDGAPIAADQVFFTTTRDEKVAFIKDAGCSHFIDDLPEVLDHPDFPDTTRRYLFGSANVNSDVVICASWRELEERIFSEQDDQDLVEVASRLAGHTIDRLEHLSSGGNSRLYRVEGGGRTYALKSYPPASSDPRDRLGVEQRALDFLVHGGVANVPRVHGVDPKRGFALMDWVDGTLVGESASEKDIDVALEFIADISALHDAPGAVALPAASEACTSGEEIVRQIDARLERLEKLDKQEVPLTEFLQGQFHPTYKVAIKRARHGYGHADGLDFEQPLDRSLQTLIPADFGFHNVMRRNDGDLVFIDFEYFGWDDPVKLTADFLLHPGIQIGQELKQRFAKGMVEVFAHDVTFPTRFDLLYPLFGLRWTLILLNEFLPERWQTRVFAQNKADWCAVKRRQLNKAMTMMDMVNESLTGGQGK